MSDDIRMARCVKIPPPACGSDRRYSFVFVAFIASLSGCLKGGFSLRSSECPEGYSRRGGTLCVPNEQDAPKLGATSCKDPDLAALKAEVEVTMCDGSVGVGTLQVCSEDAQVDCLATANFPVVKKSNFDPSDIRLGKTIAGITGTKREMKQCRNAASLAFWDFSSIADASTGTSSPNSVADLWDTVDESIGSGSPSDSPWAATYVCDSSNFTKVSEAGLQAPNTVPPGATAAFSEIWRDELSGLYFTNVLKNATVGLDWSGVMNMCSNLDSGDGVGNWRLPTQKELMQLYVNGVARVAVSGPLNIYFWSSSRSNNPTWGWKFHLWAGYSLAEPFSVTNVGAVCVR